MGDPWQVWMTPRPHPPLFQPGTPAEASPSLTSSHASSPPSSLRSTPPSSLQLDHPPGLRPSPEPGPPSLFVLVLAVRLLQAVISEVSLEQRDPVSGWRLRSSSLSSRKTVKLPEADRTLTYWIASCVSQDSCTHLHTCTFVINFDWVSATILLVLFWDKRYRQTDRQTNKQTYCITNRVS